MQQGGPAKLATYKMQNLINGKNKSTESPNNRITDATINATRESKV